VLISLGGVLGTKKTVRGSSIRSSPGSEPASGSASSTRSPPSETVTAMSAAAALYSGIFARSSSTSFVSRFAEAAAKCGVVQTTPSLMSSVTCAFHFDLAASRPERHHVAVLDPVLFGVVRVHVDEVSGCCRISVGERRLIVPCVVVLFEPRSGEDQRVLLVGHLRRWLVADALDMSEPALCVEGVLVEVLVALVALLVAGPLDPGLARRARRRSSRGRSDTPRAAPRRRPPRRRSGTRLR